MSEENQQPDWQTRTRSLIGDKAVKNLASSHVMVVGLGGVGGFSAEAVARSGVGFMSIVDGDAIDASNLNRQIVALASNVGCAKADEMKKRLLSINPKLKCNTIPVQVNALNVEKMLDLNPDYIIDAIDSMADKVALICAAKARGIPIISAMGAANRTQADLLRLEDVFHTQGDPVCRIMRRELRRRGISAHQVAYSKEIPRKVSGTLSSMVFVPGVMGLLLANACVLELAAYKDMEHGR